MTRFIAEFERSTEKADQSTGIKNAVFNGKIEITSNSINAVKTVATQLFWLPGVYKLRIRNADPECEWKEFGPIDTRNPDDATAAADKAKKRS